MKIYRAAIYERAGFGCDEVVSSFFLNRERAEVWANWHLEDIGLQHDLDDFRLCIEEIEVRE